MKWRIELFGEPRLIGFGQVITRFESRRAVALLAYLALHPQTRHPREVLADRIWPDAPLESARNRLKQALASLRRIMEPPSAPPGSVLDADRNGIGLRPGSFVCDVSEFRESVQRGDFAYASALKKGELLPGFFDEWLDDIRFELSNHELELEYPVLAASRSKGESPAERSRIHVPAPVSSFVGRERESLEVKEALSRSRWVTVTGFGGIGKTRLTLQVATNWTVGDVFFVPLAGLDAVQQAPFAIYAVLGAEPPPGAPISGIPALLAERPTLLILDNAETLQGGELAELIQQLLATCANLKILASSRLPIRGNGEVVYALSPLQVPSPSAALSELAGNESVRLFVDRARNSRPDFQVTAGNAAKIVAICGKLEGSPLAIELCAAWARLGTSAVLAKLESGQALLTARRGATGNRHESTSQVFESTCALLSPDAVRLLAQLSVFRTGFELSLLDAYCSHPPSAEAISELLEASLLIPVYDSEPERFSLLESVRQHACGLLTEEETLDCQLRFIKLFADLATQARTLTPNVSFGLRDQTDWVKFLLRNWECFYHAAQLANGKDLSQAVDIVLGTEWFWSLYVPSKDIVTTVASSDAPEIRLLEITYLEATESEEYLLRRYDELYASADVANLSLRADILLRKVKLKILRQHMHGVEELAQQAADGFERANETLNLGQAYHVLYNVAIQAGNREAGIDYRAKAERCFRACGSEVNLAALAYTECRDHYIREEYDLALAALYRCRDIAASLMNLRFMGRTANLFGVVLRHLNDEARARVYFYLSLLVSLRIRDSRGSHIPMWNLFLSLGQESRFADGVVVMGYAMATYREYFANQLDPADEKLLEEFSLKAKEVLGLVEFTALEAEGLRMSLEDAEQRVKLILTSELGDHASEVRAFIPA